MPILTTEDFTKLNDFVFERIEEGGSAFPGMSYEDGMKAVLDIMDGALTVDEATE